MSDKASLYTIVKIGGAVAEDEHIIDLLLDELRDYMGHAIVVHGGGAAVTRHARRLGLESVFSGGVRVTSSEEMEVVDMVLAGRVNTQLVRRATGRGVRAVGLTGADCALLRGKLVDLQSGSRTATVESVDLSALNALMDAGIVPIIATVGLDDAALPVNINADEAAQSLSVTMARSGKDVSLCYLSDIPGVMDVDKTVITDLPIRRIEPLITSGVVEGGMTAKLRSAATAISSGLRSVIIGGYREHGDLHRLLGGHSGTTVHNATEGVG